jgi:hypothetical protein
MMRLINETADIHKPYTGINRVEIMVQDEATLDELLEAFEKFAFASGYSFNGSLDFVQDEC